MDETTCRWEFERVDRNGNIHYASACGWDYIMESVELAQSGYIFCPNCRGRIEVADVWTVEEALG